MSIEFEYDTEYGEDPAKLSGLILESDGGLHIELDIDVQYIPEGRYFNKQSILALLDKEKTLELRDYLNKEFGGE